MELKHIQNKIVKHTILSFNRTFMELKLSVKFFYQLFVILF